jgi:membrane protease YdiL (CAAX protease family)
VIQARLAAPRRAARVTVFVLGAALLRGLLAPLGDLFSTAVFAACLLAITLIDYPLASPPHKGEGERAFTGWKGIVEERRWGTGAALIAGVAVGAALIAPVTGGGLSSRPLDAFWLWAAIAGVVASLEETAIRGALYRRWSEEAGPLAAIAIGALVFSLIHLPRYGFGALPLDFAVGVALGGLRALTGRVVPCALAHTMADWAAWFWR